MTKEEIVETILKSAILKGTDDNIVEIPFDNFFLHIYKISNSEEVFLRGFHKGGSTFFQQVMMNNTDELADTLIGLRNVGPNYTRTI